MTLLQKIANQLYDTEPNFDQLDSPSLSHLEAFDVLKQFKLLYQAIQGGDKNKALELYNTLAPEVNQLFLDYINEKETPEQAENMRDQYSKLTNEASHKYKKRSRRYDILSIVKVALDGDDPEDYVMKKLKKSLMDFNQGNLKEGLSTLGEMRMFLFPDAGDALIEPDVMDPEFVDFLSDEGMWNWIADAQSRPLSEDDQEATEMITNSISDLITRGAVFSKVELPLDIEADEL